MMPKQVERRKSMKKRMKACIRRDKKHRILRAGETVRADGRYQFKYTVDGKIKFFIAGN